VTEQEDDRLQRHDDGSVKVLVGKVIPEGSAVEQALAGRRKRVERLGAEGWHLAAYPYTFSR
jgi:hypothetical protein